jgi:hypothetical protein
MSMLAERRWVRFEWVKWPACGYHVGCPSMITGLARHGGRMSRHKKTPIRQLSGPEQKELTRICRSQVTPAVELIRAKILLAVARGDDYQTAARSVGRRSGDAVSHPVARSGAEDTAVQARRRRLCSR